ncbi:MAG: hypothetical protein ACAH59_04345 [Pseudobdellovibrionaceae bacterium]
MENTATVRIDIQRLQVLNDRLCQTLEALNQVRLSAQAPVSFGAYTGYGVPAYGWNTNPFAGYSVPTYGWNANPYMGPYAAPYSTNTPTFGNGFGYGYGGYGYTPNHNTGVGYGAGFAPAATAFTPGFNGADRTRFAGFGGYTQPTVW